MSEDICIDHGKRIGRLEKDVGELKATSEGIKKDTQNIKDRLIDEVVPILDTIKDNLTMIVPQVKGNTSWIRWIVTVGIFGSIGGIVVSIISNHVK